MKKIKDLIDRCTQVVDKELSRLEIDAEISALSTEQSIKLTSYLSTLRQLMGSDKLIESDEDELNLSHDELDALIKEKLTALLNDNKPTS